MRLLSLDLLRFGPFTDRCLRLREDARLHVVYGANEAGKTSAHAAVRNLLFGFPHSTSYDFLHRSSELRIGGEVSGRDGRRLAFLRRKGNKQTLLDHAGKPLPEDALAPFLGNVTEDVFCRAFGLDAERLRKGAEDLIAAEGEAGSSLMAAASGLRGLTELRKSLDDEAGKIFAPRAKQRRFNEISDRLKTAQDALRDHELRADAWKRLNADIATCEEELEAISQQRGELHARLSRIERLRRLAPLVRRIDAQEAALAALGALPSVGADIPHKLAAAIAAVGQARVKDEADAQALADARRQSEQITVDEALLAQDARLDDLVRRGGVSAKEEVDLPRVRAEADQFASDLARHARSLGLTLSDLEEAPPTQQSMARLQKLAAEGTALVQRRIQAQDALRTEEGVLSERSGQADPRPLQERFSAVGGYAAMVEQERKLQREIEREDRALAEEASRLYPAVGDLAPFATAPLPGNETVVRFRSAFDEIAQRVLRLRDDRETAEAQEREAEQRLAALAAGGAVPSAERIAQARAARDAVFSQLRPVLRGEQAAPVPDRDLVRFDSTLAEADHLADAAVRDAKRVAEHAAAERARLQARERQQAASRAMDEQLVAKHSLSTEWTRLWSGVTPEPLPPAEMALWLVSLRGLLPRSAALRERRGDLDAQRQELARLLPHLRDLQQSCGVAAELDPTMALRAIEVRLRDLATAWEEARAARARITRHRGELAELDLAQEAWTAEWHEALPALRLGEATTREEALAALEVWRLIPALLAERDNRQRRVVGMERNIDAFANDARALVSAIAPDLAEAGPHESVARLSQRLTQARQQRVRQVEAHKRLEACAEAARVSAARRQQAEADLSTLMQRIGTEAEPESLSDLFARQSAILDELANLRGLLLEAGDGLAEAAIRSDLADFNTDAGEVEKLSLETRSVELERQGQEVFARAEELRRRLRDAEGRITAELANQQKRNAEAELQEAAHQWAVLKIAGVLLDGALKHHRAGRQDPLMQRASALFALLTGGAYDAIDQTYGDHDEVQLVARRAGGLAVQIGHLSEGTADQFYLALRLAYVEDYASRAEAAPFLADDLFASFDDRRTDHGLRVLAQIGATVQPILFTHHRHVVDLARAALGSAVDVVELA